MSAFRFLHDNMRKHYVKNNKLTATEQIEDIMTGAPSINGGLDVEQIVDNMIMTGGNAEQHESEKPEDKKVKFAPDVLEAIKKRSINNVMEGGVIFDDEKPDIESKLDGAANNDIFPYFQEELKPAKGENIDMGKTIDMLREFFKRYGTEVKNENVMGLIQTVSHQSIKRFSARYKVTNAYIKLYEIFKRFNFNYDKEVRHFDLCAAPGMFIKAMEVICENNKWKYTYDACSKKGGLEWLDGLKNTFDFDILMQELNSKYHHRYNLVTSDVGIQYDYNDIVEPQMYDLHKAQLKHAMLLLEQGGNCILKMFSLSTNVACGIVDDFSRHFKQSYVCKPIASRVLNDECYLVGIGYDHITVHH